MQLPAILTAEHDGSIHVTDHRIELEHIIELFQAGYTANALHHHFPTLSLPLIEQVLVYYEQNRTEVDAYVAESRAIADRFYESTPKRITLEQLRTRAAKLQNTKGNQST
jgi:uncharacterized protein (DUF433 family)